MTPADTLAPPPTAQQRTADARPQLRIVHTNEQGTLVHGTSRGDGSNEPLKQARFRWSRNLGLWYLPQSRGRAARRGTIEHLVGLLERAGFGVEVELEEYDPVRAFGALQTAAGERAEVLSDRAAREQDRAEGRFGAAHDAIAGIPPGQPILVGHHSEARHRRDLARHDSNMRAGVEHSSNAQRAQDRADAASRQAQRRENPVVMGRRIERLEADQRRLERYLKGAGDAPRRRAELADVESEIAFLREAVKQSGVKQYTQADLQKGDLVRIRGRWHVVAKANAKTVALQTAYSWTDKYPYYEITDHRRPVEDEPAADKDADRPRAGSCHSTPA